MPAPHPQHVKDKVFSLHAEGYVDSEIATIVGISLGGVGGWLNGKRVHNRKPHRIKLENGNHICSRCEQEKHPDLFPNSRFNGKKLSEVSFCRECLSLAGMEWRRGTIEKYLRNRFWTLKTKAKRCSISFSITEVDLLSVYTKQNGKCFYTNEVMDTSPSRTGSSVRRSVSVDRVNPAKGYAKDNIVLCTYRANAVKQDLNVEELYEWIPMWYWRLVDAGLVKEEGDKCRSVTY